MSSGEAWNKRTGERGTALRGTGSRGTVVLSIDLELKPEHHDPALPRLLDAMRSQLLTLAANAKVPVTWAVADPMLSAASEPILRAGGGHEIAVLGDQAWLGTGCGRDRLARELARRFSVPCKAGIPVHSLVIRNVEPLIEADLLVEHGVTALALPSADQAPPRLKTTAVRYGLWEPPVAWRLPPSATWWSPTAWQVRRELQRAAQQGTVLHLRLEALQLVSAAADSCPLIHWLFAYLGRCRDAGRIELATLGDLAAAHLSHRAGTPSRSALRPAA